MNFDRALELCRRNWADFSELPSAEGVSDPTRMDAFFVRLAEAIFDATNATDLVDRLPAGLDAETKKLIGGFAGALGDKLYQSQLKGRTGWANPAWMEECRWQLVEHIKKGDPRDVAAYCAFLWYHGQPTVAYPRVVYSAPDRPGAVSLKEEIR